MSCCTDQAEPLATTTLEPTKHVNYVLGMILGEDDFKQEFAYLSGRDQWLARDLIGYGTVRGLGVRITLDSDNKGPVVYVDPGVALTPGGQLVCVPSPQCANLNAWLSKHATEVQRSAGSPPANPLSLYALLCYRECPSDKVAIPGEPCRTEDLLVQPSRLRDDFVLELSLAPPPQREEDAVRDFCKWLGQIDMSDASATSVELDRFLDEIRHAAAPWYSPPASPPLEDFLFGSPPSWLRVNPADVQAYLRAAFHLWVTELRPKWYARWLGCAPDLEEATQLSNCVLLAELQVPLVAAPGSGVFQAADGSLPTVLQDRRPYIVHLRMLQEWLLCRAQTVVAGGGGGAGPAPGNTVVSETNFGQAPDPGNSQSYARANHTHGTPALVGDVRIEAASNVVRSIQTVPVVATGAQPGQVLTFQANAWRPAPLPTAPSVSLAGEVTGPANGNRVSALLGVPVPPPAGPLQNGQVLAFSQGTNTWVPTSPVPPAGQFVGRGGPQAYSIVAAGAFRFPIAPGQIVPPGTSAPTPVTASSSYNGLVALGVYDAPRGGFKFTFNNPVAAATYIVKITPWAPKGSGSSNPFMAYFSDFETTPAPFGFFVTVTVNPNATITAGALIIEVSQIG